MLKSLEVFGFKSFADRTTFEFAPGTTCVVGPNGSGKSNVVDAMKWLLGDQSPKSLRGKNMADVIFNGSRSRKPSGFAEATLAFDNSESILQLDEPEVRITRRLYQGGDSEYLINGETSRLKDIRELFMGTGAATSAYSIIEQGRVGQVLQGNPSTRRILFDEAAGISRFKLRRVDAERKLDRVSQNLLRLTDIVDEVETQLNACRSQAGKATKFRELTRSYDAFWLGLAADEARRLHSRLTTLRDRSAELTAQVASARQEHDAVEAEREQLRLAFSQADEQLQSIEGKLSELMQQRSSLQTSLRYQWDRSGELEAETQTLSVQRIELKSRAQEITQEIEAVERQCQQARQAVENKQNEQNADQNQLEQVEARIEQLRQQRRDFAEAAQQATRQQAASENHLSHLQTRQQTLMQAIERNTVEAEAAGELVSHRQEHVAAAEQSHAQAMQRNQQQREQIDAIADRRSTLKQELATIHARLRADREQRSAWEARLGLLEDMERRQLGVSLGVQDILARAKRSPLPPWNHVLGILPDFIECDLEFAPLIEIALGGSAQLVIVDRLGPVLEYLDAGETLFEGRLSFLELTPSLADVDEVAETPELTKTADLEADFFQQLSDNPNVVSRADELIRCDPSFRPLVERLLKQTWIVSQLAAARQLTWTAPPSVRFLTLQGDLLDVNGRVQTGTLQPEGSVVSRRSEIRRIKNELQQLDRHIERLTEKTGEFDQILSRLDEELEHAQSWMDTQSSELAELKQELVSHQAELKQAQLEQERLKNNRETVQEQLAAAAAEIEHEQQRLDDFETKIRELQTQSNELENELQETQRSRQELIEGRSQFELELAKVTERLTAAESTQNRLRKDQQSRNEQFAEAAERLLQSQSKRSRLELQILNAQSRLAELYLIGEHLQHEVRAARRKRGETQIVRDRLNDRLKDLSEVRREREEALQDQRIEQRDLDNELQTLAEKVFEEYQYTLLDLVQGGLSACTPYLQERQGEDVQAVEYPPRRTAPAEPNDDANDDGTAETTTELESSPEPVSVDLAELLDLQGIESIPWPWADCEIEYDQARPEVERTVNRLRKKIKALGAVDPDSLKGLDELESRFGHLNTQLKDLQHAKSTLEDIIRKINHESRRIFVESFNTIREHFKDLFRQLFGGGEGDVMMEDDSDPLECGIEIVARPPGKELRSISLLSGGEKTMTAVGLLLAIFRSRPSPFCILDEVDAALDEANIDRFANVIGQFQDKTQFIVITHRKRTMTAADRIFGVTMEEAGVSKRLTVRFEDVGENGEINTKGNAAA